MRIAIIGAGISGLTHAAILKRLGHDIVLLEKEATIAGIWAQAYPEVRLQNIARQYFVSDLPWPDPPDEHPTARQIRDYMESLVQKFELAPRLATEVERLEEKDDGWRVHTKGPNGAQAHDVDFVIIATGQYSQPKASEQIPGREDFEGELVSERSLESLETFRGRRVLVVGFGKSALDLAAFAARRDAKVQHVFRTPRWLLPLRFFGVLHYTYALFTRFGSVMVPCWTHPTFVARVLLHRLGAPLVSAFWWTLSVGVWRQFRSSAAGLGREARRRVDLLRPDHPLVKDMRSAAAIAPDDYMRLVAKGDIDPVKNEVTRVTPKGLRLSDGTELEGDVLVLATGSASPRFPFLPQKYRRLLESSPDGPQLYRHILHPRIPRLAFAGYNHGFLHIPAAEVGALWIDAVLVGRLQLPSVEAMESTMHHVASWKSEHITFEPSRSCAVNTRFQQYLDVLLSELGISPYRKLPNVFAELFSRYGPADYAGILKEYTAKKGRRLRSSRLPT